MNKKLLYIMGGILGLIIVLALVIFVITSKKNTSNDARNVELQDSQQTETTDNQQNNEKISKLRKLSNEPVLAPALSYDNQAFWYFTAAGSLYKVNLDSGLRKEFLLPEKLTVTDAIWPITGNDFIVVTGAGASKSFYYYDSDKKDDPNQKFIKYPAAVKEVDFMPDGKNVLYNWVAEGKSNLSTAKFDLTGYQSIIFIPVQDATLKVSPKGDRAFLYDAKNPGDGKLGYVDVNNKKGFVIYTGNENGGVWSPDGVHFVFKKGSKEDSSSDELWLGDSNSQQNDKSLGINGTISKVVFDKKGEYLIAAIKDNGTDTFWKINLKTMAKNKFFTAADAGSTKVSASNMLLSEDGKTLYFKNSDGFLYSVPVQ